MRFVNEKFRMGLYFMIYLKGEKHFLLKCAVVAYFEHMNISSNNREENRQWK